MKSTVVEAATSAAPPATVTQTASDGGQAFKLRRHVTVPTTAKAATAAATFGGPAASNGMQKVGMLAFRLGARCAGGLGAGSAFQPRDG